MDTDTTASCQLILGIAGACRFLLSTKRDSAVQKALLSLQRDEGVRELLFPTEMSVFVGMLKRAKQDFCVDLGLPGRDFTIEHYQNETLYVFNAEGQLIGVEHEYPPK
jgi:hypothetical protein